ncbi:MAG: SCO family protein [Candidatus Kariarchaeaceae archaeon]
MVKLSPLEKRYLAMGIVFGLSMILIGSSAYQLFFANSIDGLFYNGEIEEFTLPGTEGEYTFVPGSHEVTVVSFIYTKCPGDQGCSLLTVNMAELEDRLERKDLKDRVEFVSIDFDYINDTMEDLIDYRNEYTQDIEFWHFLLGNQEQTDAIAEQFAFFFAVNNDTEGLQPSHGGDGKDPYLHLMVTYFLDREANMRKILSGTEWDFRVVDDYIDFLLSKNWRDTP